MAVDRITSEWVRTPADEHAVRAGCYFDLAAAERMRSFIETFLYVPPPLSVQMELMAIGEAAAKARPMKLLDWQWDRVIAPIFGWKRKDGRRRFNRGYLSMAKKNGKTILGSAITMCFLLADGEPNPECYSVASSRDQAGLIYGDCAGMSTASPDVARHVRRLDSKKRLVCSSINGFYQSLSSDKDSSDGIRAHLVINDELHRAAGREMFDHLRSSGIARRQPLNLTLTTAGDGADPTHVCREEYDYAKAVAVGAQRDPFYFSCIFEAPEGCDLDDRAAWKLANPSLGLALLEETIEEKITEAKGSPAKEPAVRRYTLNQWVSNADAWISDTLWLACPNDVTEESVAGRSCYMGADLSATDDLTAVARIFAPTESDPQTKLLVQFFCPADKIIALSEKHRVPYQAWQKQGWIIATPGNVVDYEVVRQWIKDAAGRTPVTMLGMDRGWQGQALETQLIEDGFAMVAVGQGWKSQSQPLKEIEKLIKAERLNHGGNPVMQWNMLNARVKVDDAFNYSLTKSLSRSKIDGVAAFANAMHCMLFGSTPQEFTASDIIG